MSNGIFPGISVFIADRPGNHCYLDNNKRPPLSVTLTDESGIRKYDNLFCNSSVKVTVNKKAKTITFVCPLHATQPAFSILHKS